ncbi:riboflavin biosynthesis protein RibD [Spirochaetota bacterium]|nr:riboflavin biosynthesis protein RibD [Spirochaetota bacterium]
MKPKNQADHTSYFTETLNAAILAKWIARPNPAVGATLVVTPQSTSHRTKNTSQAKNLAPQAESAHSPHLVTTGFTQPIGAAHAEIIALRKMTHLLAKNRSAKLTSAHLNKELYVSLTPCTFQGRTPPCVTALIKNNIDRVHIGLADNDPRIGNATTMLEKAGIEVLTDFPIAIKRQLFALNEDYYFKHHTQYPLITVKYAMTLDGYTATHTGHSKWITGEHARSDANALRGHCDAVLIGARTFLLDNPSLKTRLPTTQLTPTIRSIKHPRAVVWFSRDFSPQEQNDLKNSLSKYPSSSPYQLLTKKPTPHKDNKDVKNGREPLSNNSNSNDNDNEPIFIIQPHFNRIREIFSGYHVRFYEINAGALTKPSAFRAMIKDLAKMYHFNSIFVEGGAHTASLFRWSNLMHRIIVYIAPKVMQDVGTVTSKQLSPLLAVGSYLKDIKHNGNQPPFPTPINPSKPPNKEPFTDLAESFHKILAQDIRISAYKDDYHIIQSLRKQLIGTQTDSH